MIDVGRRSKIYSPVETMHMKFSAAQTAHYGSHISIQIIRISMFAAKSPEGRVRELISARTAIALLRVSTRIVRSPSDRGRN